jgi:hypothetical protein
MRGKAAERTEGCKRGLAASTRPLPPRAHRESAEGIIGEQHEPDTADSGVGSGRRSVLLGKQYGDGRAAAGRVCDGKCVSESVC